MMRWEMARGGIETPRAANGGPVDSGSGQQEGMPRGVSSLAAAPWPGFTTCWRFGRVEPCISWAESLACAAPMLI